MPLLVVGYGYACALRPCITVIPFQNWSDDGGFWMYIDGVCF